MGCSGVTQIIWKGNCGIIQWHLIHYTSVISWRTWHMKNHSRRAHITGSNHCCLHSHSAVISTVCHSDERWNWLSRRNWGCKLSALSINIFAFNRILKGELRRRICGIKKTTYLVLMLLMLLILSIVNLLSHGSSIITSLLTSLVADHLSEQQNGRRTQFTLQGFPTLLFFFISLHVD